MRHPSNISADPLNPRKLRESLYPASTIRERFGNPEEPDTSRSAGNLYAEPETVRLGSDPAG